MTIFTEYIPSALVPGLYKTAVTNHGCRCSITKQRCNKAKASVISSSFFVEQTKLFSIYHINHMAGNFRIS